jgi:hypothetical protein
MAMTEGFYIFLISSSFAFLTFIGRMCYKSKCSEIKCFGVKIIRDVEQETEDLRSNGNQLTPNQSQNHML